MNFNIKKTNIQLLKDNGEIYLKKGILLEGNGLCAIYADGHFDFVCTSAHETGNMLATKNLVMNELKEERLCSKCEVSMQEGFYFESDGTQYCSEECLLKVISRKDYLKIYDNGNGNAYWTDWYDS